MANSNGTKNVSCTAGESLASKQYYVVKLSAARTVVGVSAATDAPYGINQHEAASGGVTSVQRYGISKAVAGAAIAAGAEVYALASGKLTSVPVLGSYAIGKAVDAASGDGSIFSVELDIAPHPVPVVAFSIPVVLSTADNANVAKFVPGFAGRFVSIESTVTTVTANTTGNQAILNLDIAGTNVTGGVVTIDVDVPAADPDTLGKRIAGTAITAGNVFTASQEVTLEAANTSAFTSGVVLVTVLAIQG